MTAADGLDADVFERGVPDALFAALRRDDPVHRHASGFWSVTRHADVTAVSRDHAAFSSQLGGTTMEDVTAADLEARRSLIDTDGAVHTAQRRLVSSRFTPVTVRRDWTAFVERLVTDTLDEALRSDEFDAVEDLASVIPIRVLGELLGLPRDDQHVLMELGDEMIAGTDPDHAPRGGPDRRFAGYPFSSAAGKDLWEYAAALRALRRDDLGPDLFSLLLTGQIDGRELTPRELDNWFAMLVVAGNETTRMALAHGIAAFAAYPDQFRRLRRDPGLLRPATEEVLRWATPLHHFRRTATRDVELSGRRIAAGDKVVIWYISANRDETVFPDPLAFDIGRDPNPHLAFGGGGKHFCLGAGLARLEIAVTLRLLAARLTAIEPTGPMVRTRSNLTHGVKALPVRVHRA